MVRTKGGSRKGKEVVEGSKRRRSTLRIEEPENEEPEYPTTFLVSEEAEQLMAERYGIRKILYGRVLDVQFFRDFPLMEWFRIQGWKRLFAKKFPVYPNLVRTFYANAVVEEGNRGFFLRCYVKGKYFTLTSVDINEIFGIVSLANRSYNPINPTAAKAELLGRYAGLRASHAKYLDIDTRIVMLIVHWMIKPISGHMTTMSDAVAKIVYDIKHGNYVDLGKVMVEHICGIKQIKTSNMPYGMWLTPIFERMGVDLSDEMQTQLKMYKVILGETSMSNMGLEKDENGEWRRKDAARMIMSEEEGDDENEEEEEERAGQEEQTIPEGNEPGVGTSSFPGSMSYTARFDYIEEEMRSIRRTQDTHYQTMDTRMTRVDENVTGMRGDINELRGEWTSFNEFMRGYITQHPADFPPQPPSDEE